MKKYLNTSLSDFIKESKTVQLKRQYKNNPSIVVESAAPVRNKVIEFIKEHKAVSKNVLRKFIKENFSYKNPNTANAAITQWIKRNDKFFITESKGGVEIIKLSSLGNKLYESINEGCNCTNPKTKRPTRNLIESSKHPKGRTRKLNEWFDDENDMDDEDYEDMEQEREFLNNYTKGDKSISTIRRETEFIPDEEDEEIEHYDDNYSEFEDEPESEEWSDDFFEEEWNEDEEWIDDEDDTLEPEQEEDVPYDFIDKKRGYPRMGINDNTVEESDDEDDFFEKYGEENYDENGLERDEYGEHTGRFDHSRDRFNADDEDVNEDDGSDVDETVSEELEDEYFEDDSQITFEFNNDDPNSEFPCITVSAMDEEEAKDKFNSTFGDILNVDEYSCTSCDEDMDDFDEDIEESDVDSAQIPELTESRKARLRKVINEMTKSNSKSKLNEEELKDEDDEELSDDDDDMDALFSSIKSEDDNKDLDTETTDTDTDNIDSDEEDDRVEITEFILSVDDPEAAIAELSEIGVEAELVEDETEDTEDVEDTDTEDVEDLDNEDNTDLEDTDTEDVEDLDTNESAKTKKSKKLNEGEIRVSVDNWDALRGWLEEKGVDVDELLGGEIEVETEEDEDLTDEDTDAEDFEDEDDIVDFEDSDEDEEASSDEESDKELDI